MAALSRPSLRPSARRNASLTEVPPTDIQQTPVPSTQRGKRTRDSSPGSQSNASIKRQKAQTQDTTRTKAIPRSEVSKSLPIRDKAGTKELVTQVGNLRKLDLPTQESPNGSTITAHNNRVVNRNASLVINTANTPSQAEKRSLRSHDGGSRSKSELALYFPNYDDLVSIEPKEPGKHWGRYYSDSCTDITRFPHPRDPHTHYRRAFKINREKLLILFMFPTCRQQATLL